MRITFILESFNRGGKERRCLQLIQGLNRVGCNEIQLIIVNNGVEYPEVYDTTASIIVIDKAAKGLSVCKIYKTIKSHIDEFSPEIIQAWGEVSMMYITMLKASRKFVYVCANVADCNKLKWYSLKSLVTRISYRYADAVVGNSLAGLKAYSAPKSKSHCIYNGFNEARFKAVDNIDFNKVRSDLDVKTKYLVSMFARVDHYKDYDSFVALFKEIREIRDDVTFLAVGGGIDYEKYRDMYSNDSGLRFIGLRSDVEALMSVTDVSVLFSNYKFHKEGISNSILESMALGTPVIATNDGGSPEIITDAVNGYLVDDNNITQAARILSELLDNPELLIRLGRNARETVLEKFLLETMVRNYVSLYDDLLSRKMI